MPQPSSVAAPGFGNKLPGGQPIERPALRPLACRTVNAAQASTSRRGLGSTAIEAAEDVVEPALGQALEQHAALELVRSEAARRLMAVRGAMAALLR